MSTYVGNLPLWLRLRNWLITRLAGRSVVMINVRLELVDSDFGCFLVKGLNRALIDVELSGPWSAQALKITSAHQVDDGPETAPADGEKQ